MIKIHVLHTGYVNISESLAFRDEVKKPSLPQLSILSSYGRKNRRCFPVSVYFIEHPEASILFDCGWSKDMSPNGNYSKLAQIRHMSLPLFLANQGYVPKGKSLEGQLFETPDYVVLSHLDVDHASGLCEVKNSPNIMVSDKELEFAKKNKLRYVSRMWDDVDLKTFNFKQDNPSIKTGPVGRSYDLLGDGSVELINIPGHTPGLTAMKISHDEKFVLLFSDGGYGTASWKDLIMPGICDDEKSAFESLKWIRTLSLDKNCVESLANHDMNVRPHVIEL
ncbi:MAG: N-acyl homoserine lactonase family protein [Methanobrevibacter sp.]|uniref:N-acyl homoserine lactonase family protein n=1 Tax=Methanobrevibacter sp. TaxID=66852 RepID=UPI0025DFA57E|nr:N-acyl homoserine lactonase family protein [Methanobrevibacter sp.]MBR0271749.1 N-acyl homoserine lactonase family protein [Methanobrevibacter sp.]